MDMSVQPQQGLRLAQGLHQGAAAGVHAHGIAHVEHHLEVLVELRALVQHGPVGRNVHVEDAPAHVLHLRDQLRETLPVLVFGVLALGIPGRDGRAADVQHLVAADFGDLHLVVLDVRRGVEHIVHLEEIVVARSGDQRNAGSGKLLARKLAPLLHPIAHELLEQRLAPRFVRRELPKLVLRHDGGIEPHVGGAAAVRLDLVLAAQGHGIARAVGKMAAVRLLADGQHRLTGQVAAQHQDVGAVEPGAVDELPEAHGGTVQIRREEDREALAALSRSFLAERPHVVQRQNLVRY